MQRMKAHLNLNTTDFILRRMRRSRRVISAPCLVANNEVAESVTAVQYSEIFSQEACLLNQ
jgi:hypothetical protein